MTRGATHSRLGTPEKSALSTDGQQGSVTHLDEELHRLDACSEQSGARRSVLLTRRGRVHMRLRFCRLALQVGVYMTGWQYARFQHAHSNMRAVAFCNIHNAAAGVNSKLV